MSTEETVYDILRRLGASEHLVQSFAMLTQGREWYHPCVIKANRRAALHAAILADRRGDVKEVARDFKVSIWTVYRLRKKQVLAPPGR